jgi:hypothetical protein
MTLTLSQAFESYEMSPPGGDTTGHDAPARGTYRAQTVARSSSTASNGSARTFASSS